jgi:two-component system, chemotaxis family, sensor kinase Cph1
MPKPANPAPDRTRMEPYDERVLRRRAEQRLPARAVDPEPIPHDPDLDLDRDRNLRAERMLHELQVHELELAMQNEDLRTARADEAEALRCYVDLFDHAPVGYLTLTPRGAIEQVNQCGVLLLGATQSALAGKPLASFVLAPDRPAMQVALEQARVDPGIATCEVRVGDGSDRDLQLQVRSDPGGASLLVALVDISARRRAEAAERDVLVLQESQRLHAALLSRFSHEMRTPLNAINGFSELMLEADQPPLAPEQRQMLNHILHAGQHLLDLVSGVLSQGDLDSERR